MHLKRFTFQLLLFMLAGTVHCGSADSYGKFDKQFANFCSKLDFTDVTWSESMPVNYREPFALALNLTGSFEGNEGWANLANNFDGMGISLGLLNQNLGQGTLQPLFIELRNKSLDTMNTVFPAGNLNSLLDMLAKWETGPAMMHIKQAQMLRAYGFSSLDDEEVVAEELGIPSSDLESVEANASRNIASVTWAKQVVLAGKSIKSDWSEQLKLASASAAYRSIQVDEARSLHNVAMNLFKTYSLTEKRSYLFMFDIVVQNGGLPDPILAKYKAYVKANPKATETAKLNRILTLRLPYVKKRFRRDVQSRKQAIILGKGRVHGHSRNIESEYCTDINTTMP